MPRSTNGFSHDVWMSHDPLATTHVTDAAPRTDAALQPADPAASQHPTSPLTSAATSCQIQAAPRTKEGRSRSALVLEDHRAQRSRSDRRSRAGLSPGFAGSRAAADVRRSSDIERPISSFGADVRRCHPVVAHRPRPRGAPCGLGRKRHRQFAHRLPDGPGARIRRQAQYSPGGALHGRTGSRAGGGDLGTSAGLAWCRPLA